MSAHSVCVLSGLGLLGLVLATPVSHAQGLTPGQAAPPLQTLDLTKPGPRPSAVTQRVAPAAVAKPTPKSLATVSGAAPAKARPGTLVATGPARKTAKAPPKAAKGKPAPKPAPSTAGDR